MQRLRPLGDERDIRRAFVVAGYQQEDIVGPYKRRQSVQADCTVSRRSRPYKLRITEVSASDGGICASTAHANPRAAHTQAKSRSLMPGRLRCEQMKQDEEVFVGISFQSKVASVC